MALLISTRWDMQGKGYCYFFRKALTLFINSSLIPYPPSHSIPSRDAQWVHWGLKHLRSFSSSSKSTPSCSCGRQVVLASADGILLWAVLASLGTESRSYRNVPWGCWGGTPPLYTDPTPDFCASDLSHASPVAELSAARQPAGQPTGAAFGQAGGCAHTSEHRFTARDPPSSP